MKDIYQLDLNLIQTKFKDEVPFSLHTRLEDNYEKADYLEAPINEFLGTFHHPKEHGADATRDDLSLRVELLNEKHGNYCNDTRLRRLKHNLRGVKHKLILVSYIDFFTPEQLHELREIKVRIVEIGHQILSRSERQRKYLINLFKSVLFKILPRFPYLYDLNSNSLSDISSLDSKSVRSSINQIEPCKPLLRNPCDVKGVELLIRRSHLRHNNLLEWNNGTRVWYPINRNNITFVTVPPSVQILLFNALTRGKTFKVRAKYSRPNLHVFSIV